jgi:hypothetical protein
MGKSRVRPAEQVRNSTEPGIIASQDLAPVGARDRVHALDPLFGVGALNRNRPPVDLSLPRTEP